MGGFHVPSPPSERALCIAVEEGALNEWGHLSLKSKDRNRGLKPFRPQ